MSKFYRIALIFLITGVIGFAKPVVAQVGDPYIFGNIGLTQFTEQDVDVGPAVFGLDYDVGFNIEGGVGTTFAPQFRGEMGLSLKHASPDTFAGSSVDGTATTFHVTGTAFFDFTEGQPLTPYVGAGIGLGVISAEAGTESESAFSFAFQLPLGVSYKIQPNMDFNAFYRFWLSSPITIADADVSNIFAHELSVGLRYYF